MPMHFAGGDIVPGVSATLILGTLSATSVTLTLSLSAGATLVSWSVRRSPKGVNTWTTIATGLTDLTYVATGLNPSPAEYDFQADVVVQESVTSNAVVVATAEQVYLPLLEDRTYAIPGGGTLGNATIAGGESRLLRLQTPGLTQAFTDVEVILLNPRDTPYYVKFAAIGNMDANQSAGFANLITADTMVPAGDGLFSHDGGQDSLRPGVLSLGRHAITMSGGNGFQLAIELSADAPGCFWGGEAIGYEHTLNKLPRSLQATWDLSGEVESFGQQPCLAVIFYGLTIPVVTLPFLGDSWIMGYGDNDQPIPGAVGVPIRLETRWRNAGVRISPVNFGRVGATTSQMAARADWFADVFAPRCAAMQYYSINNDTLGEGIANVETDFVSALGSVAPQPVLPLILAGNNVGTEEWWPAVDALQDACKISRPTTIDLSTPIVNSADGTINSGRNYGTSHPNELGYDEMELGSHAAIRTWCEAMGGQSL